MARLNNRSKQTFWYALYDSTRVGYDDYGNENAAYPVYGNPVKAYGNISAARGNVDARQFGDDINYDKTIVVEDRDTPINESSVLWIDREPDVNFLGELTVNANGDYVTPWDYIVRKVGRGLPEGAAIIAVSKVNVR